MITLISIKTKDLKPNQVTSICKLKNTQWKYSFKSQLTWFKKHNLKTDLHNLLIFKNKIIGYTSLRLRNLEHSNKKYSNILMKFNNSIILLNKKISFLICEKEMVNFYQKFDWYKIKKQTYEILDHTTVKIGMIYNRNSLNKIQKKINFNFKKISEK